MDSAARSEVGLRGHRVQSPKRAEARYRAILFAAAKVFADKGYFAATMEDIAGALGSTKGILYYYFRGKEEIYAAIRVATIEDAIERARAIVCRPLPTEEMLRAVVADLIGHIFGSLDSYAISNLQDWKVLAPHNRQRIRGLQRKYESMLIDIVRRGMNEGVFVKRDPVVTTFTLVRAAVSVGLWYRPDGRLDPERITRDVTDQVMTGVTIREEWPGVGAGK